MNHTQAMALMEAIDWYVEAKVVALNKGTWGIPKESKMTVNESRNQLRKTILACCGEDK